jgi:hypothetical protein
MSIGNDEFILGEKMYAFILPFIFILFSCAPENRKSELSGEGSKKLYDHWDPRTIEYKTIHDRVTEDYIYMIEKCDKVYQDENDVDELRRFLAEKKPSHKCGNKLGDLGINCVKLVAACTTTVGARPRVKASTNCESSILQGVKAATEFYQECIMGGAAYFPKHSGGNKFKSDSN